MTRRILILWMLTAFCRLADASPLSDYVARPDPAYHFTIKEKLQLKRGVTGYEVELVSQVWHDITWTHVLRFVMPEKLAKDPTGAILIIGGSSRPGEKDYKYGDQLASDLAAPVAILYDVPFQPLFGGLKEDKLLAETFDRYQKTGDKTWPILLPMVKSAMRAMDALETMVKDEHKTAVSGFLVTGPSKRGWTTWLTGIVDPRVKAIVPMVYDNLNLPAQMKHQLESWGTYSKSIAAYTDKNMPQKLIDGDPEARALADIIDPYVYRDALKMPKLIVNGSNDPYWTLDALNIYWNDLPGEKYVLYVPNAAHNVKEGRDEVVNTVLSFFKHMDGRIPFPKIEASFRREQGQFRADLSSDIAPWQTTLWIAYSTTRDFRNSKWSDYNLNGEAGQYEGAVADEPENFAAAFGECVYVMDHVDFPLSSRVSIFGPVVPPAKREGEKGAENK